MYYPHIAIDPSFTPAAAVERVNLKISIKMSCSGLPATIQPLSA